MGNSPLVCYTKLSPNCNKPRNQKIMKITPHHMAGNCTIETCGEIFARSSRGASSNYGIGTDGRIGMYVEECNRSWCSSSGANDHQAITIEVANDSDAPNWHVSDKALAALIDLCTDICIRHGIEKLVFTGDKTGNLTMHKYFAATACPGPYLESKFPYIAAEVNKRLGQATPTISAPTPSSSFIVKILCDELNVRSAPGTQSKVVTIVRKGQAYTIVATQKVGAVTWGKLKSGAGWISLLEKYVKKI